ncbi:hypothetical protein LR965_07145 [Limosilactobacillus fermentum]|nr:hypothetical protein [Limosilactobacillus fermentum]MCE0560799.1 hypothetical protein [Limosilactobacillus fermentum]
MESNLTVKAPTIHRARLAWSLYINYFIHGFGLIILAQNMTSLGAGLEQPPENCLLCYFRSWDRASLVLPDYRVFS